MTGMTPILVQGSKVTIKEFEQVVDTVLVVADKRTELVIERLSEDGKPTGSREEFAYKPELGGWVLLFEGMGTERCYSTRGSVYQIVPAT